MERPASGWTGSQFDRPIIRLLFLLKSTITELTCIKSSPLCIFYLKRHVSMRIGVGNQSFGWQ